jgi:predicted XRE-type DNA-binding protein
MSKKRFESVWDAIEDTPQEAASMRARSHLMIELTELIRHEGWTQKVAAERFGVTQPRISDLMRGKVDLFSLDTLIDMATVAGLSPRIMIRKAA